ncbi:MAG: threonine aldolase family protein, partial [Caulobacteraceae bacterium]
PAFFGGGLAIAPLDGEGGLIAPRSLAAALSDREETHRQAPAVLSLTQASELGTLYSPARLASLAGMAKEAGLRVQVDGARLANAIAAGFDPRSLARAGVAAAVIGGTKAGATPSEAIALFDKSLSRRFAGRLKHAGQLVSKARFFAAPWIGMLESGAWISRARHANTMARRLAELTPFPLAHPVESNAVFMTMSATAFDRLAAAGWIVYRFEDGSVRALCSWATSLESVEAFAADLRAAADPGAAADKRPAKRASAGARR